MKEIIDLTKDDEVYYIGIDVNTKSTGYCIFKNKTRVIKWGVFLNDTPGDNLISYGRKIGNLLNDIKTEYNIKKVNIFIEDYLRSFKFNHTTCTALTKMAEMNGIVSLCSAIVFDTKITKLSCKRARKYIGLVNGKSNIKSKCIDYAKRNCNLLMCENLTENMQSDVADAYIIAILGISLD